MASWDTITTDTIVYVANRWTPRCKHKVATSEQVDSLTRTLRHNVWSQFPTNDAGFARTT